MSFIISSFVLRPHIHCPASTDKTATPTYEQLHAEVRRVAGGLVNGERAARILLPSTSTSVSRPSHRSSEPPRRRGFSVPINPVFKARQVAYIMPTAMFDFLSRPRQRLEPPPPRAAPSLPGPRAIVSSAGTASYCLGAVVDDTLRPPLGGVWDAYAAADAETGVVDTDISRRSSTPRGVPASQRVLSSATATC